MHPFSIHAGHFEQDFSIKPRTNIRIMTREPTPQQLLLLILGTDRMGQDSQNRLT